MQVHLKWSKFAVSVLALSLCTPTSLAQTDPELGVTWWAHLNTGSEVSAQRLGEASSRVIIPRSRWRCVASESRRDATFVHGIRELTCRRGSFSVSATVVCQPRRTIQCIGDSHRVLRLSERRSDGSEHDVIVSLRCRNDGEGEM